MSTKDEPKGASKSLLRQFLKGSLVTAGVLFALAFALLALRPEFMLFYPSPFVGETPASRGWDYESVEIETEDGERLGAWYLPAQGEVGPGAGQAVLYCHGNAGNIGHRLGAVSGLRSLGVAVLIFDYRGYGESTGRATTAGTRLDVQAAWEHLVERGHAPEDIVLWGRSLGGAVAIDQAARASEAGTPPAALVVESTFTSTLDIGEAVYPWLPVRLLGGKLDYPSKTLMATVDAPVLVAHSPDDDLVPASHGDALLDAAASGEAPRTAFIALTGGHNDGHLTGPDHSHAVREFLWPSPQLR